MSDVAAARAGFMLLDRLLVPRSLADSAQRHLRKVGRSGNEGFALWAGRFQGREFVVEETIIPAQHAMRCETGVCVRVDGDELFRINRHLYSIGRLLVAQLHSHPTEAYHSETDDEYPIATTAGAFSLVIPDFAVRDFALDDCAVYRLVPGQGWLEFPATAVRAVVYLTDG
ncbi:MAG: Mov34/MPN/PAD-1 family protein [Gemmatimonadaceae bacterium]